VTRMAIEKFSGWLTGYKLNRLSEKIKNIFEVYIFSYRTT